MLESLYLTPKTIIRVEIHQFILPPISLQVEVFIGKIKICTWLQIFDLGESQPRKVAVTNIGELGISKVFSSHPLLGYNTPEQWGGGSYKMAVSTLKKIFFSSKRSLNKISKVPASACTCIVLQFTWINISYISFVKLIQIVKSR